MWASAACSRETAGQRRYVGAAGVEPAISRCKTADPQRHAHPHSRRSAASVTPRVIRCLSRACRPAQNVSGGCGSLRAWGRVVASLGEPVLQRFVEQEPHGLLERDCPLVSAGGRRQPTIRSTVSVGTQQMMSAYLELSNIPPPPVCDPIEYIVGGCQ
jgi:hypothetical protein